MRFIITALCLLFFAVPLAGHAAITSKTENTTATLIVEPRALTSGESVWVGIHFDLAPHWHLYWKNPGDSGLEATYEWSLPEGVSAGPIHWPAPKRIEYEGLYNYGFEDSVTLLAPVTKTEAANGDVSVILQADWLVCKEICIPESATFEFTLPADGTFEHASEQMVIDAATDLLPAPFKGEAYYKAGEKNVEIGVSHADFAAKGVETIWWFPLKDGIITNGSNQPFVQDGQQVTITAERGSIPLVESYSGTLEVRYKDGSHELFHVDAKQLNGEVSAMPNASGVTPAAPIATEEMSVLGAIFFALLGGIILNAMPCVLPVLSLKALSISKKAEKAASEVRLHGLSYTTGIVLSFLAIAIALISLKAAGHAIGWGFQLQSPAFVSVLIYVLLLVGLNLSGVFEIPSLFANVGANKANESSLSGSFFTGVLATLVATPCTAPFMAPAIGFAVTQSTAAMLMIFAALGFGLALPLLLISFLPQLYRLLPKPGAWMLRFKQFLAFPIYASAAWLLWVLAQQSGAMGLAYALAGMCLIAFVAWLIPLLHNHVVRIIAILTTVWLLWLTVQHQIVAPVQHIMSDDEAFSFERLESHRAAGTAVFVDATAAWCITCKVNEQIALNTAQVRAAFEKQGIVFMVADWTNQDAEITEFLASFGRNGVPLYVYYAPGAEPVVLPQILSPSIVLEAISKP
ncbi:MAG: thioredoxin family protein [Rickettsiales bacterium]|nr:thioredoxin family protein [Rickettsiales bacterium]